ncbi:hypothetical protein B0919_20135 [Hymenobacter sp. CRA2]|nr:hypothetical protein B0919_20135 [Hymenobacter sp. CRA2]
MLKQTIKHIFDQALFIASRFLFVILSGSIVCSIRIFFSINILFAFKLIIRTTLAVLLSSFIYYYIV